MFWTELIICLLLISGLFSILGIEFTDFFKPRRVSNPSTLLDDMDAMLGKPAKGFFRKETAEVEEILNSTGRKNRFGTIKKLCLLGFAAGTVIALLLNNPFLVPVLAAAMAMAPVWYLRATAVVYKKRLNEELETAVSVITTSYLRTEDLLKSVKENLPYLTPPIKNHFESFVTESEILNANMISTINTLKMKIPNRIFHEWCNTLIQCQSDRSMKHTLSFTLQKFSDARVVQADLEAIINGPRNEAYIMMALVVCNIPLLYILNKSWFETLVFTIPGKITMAVCAALILFSFSRINALSKPIEYQ